MARRKPYPWFMRWSRIDVIKRGSGYVYRVTFLPTGLAAEGADRDEAAGKLGGALGAPVAGLRDGCGD
jgi:hypothetical protein